MARDRLPPMAMLWRPETKSQERHTPEGHMAELSAPMGPSRHHSRTRRIEKSGRRALDPAKRVLDTVSPAADRCGICSGQFRRPRDTAKETRYR